MLNTTLLPALAAGFAWERSSPAAPFASTAGGAGGAAGALDGGCESFEAWQARMQAWESAQQQGAVLEGSMLRSLDEAQEGLDAVLAAAAVAVTAQAQHSSSVGAGSAGGGAGASDADWAGSSSGRGSASGSSGGRAAYAGAAPPVDVLSGPKLAEVLTALCQLRPRFRPPADWWHHYQRAAWAQLPHMDASSISRILWAAGRLRLQPLPGWVLMLTSALTPARLGALDDGGSLRLLLGLAALNVQAWHLPAIEAAAEEVAPSGWWASAPQAAAVAEEGADAAPGAEGTAEEGAGAAPAAEEAEGEAAFAAAAASDSGSDSDSAPHDEQLAAAADTQPASAAATSEAAPALGAHHWYAALCSQLAAHLSHGCYEEGQSLTHMARALGRLCESSGGGLCPPQLLTEALIEGTRGPLAQRRWDFQALCALLWGLNQLGVRPDEEWLRRWAAYKGGGGVRCGLHV